MVAVSEGQVLQSYNPLAANPRRSFLPSAFNFRLIEPWTITFPTLEPVKARFVINEQLSLALLADIVSLQEDIDRADFEARSIPSTLNTEAGSNRSMSLP